jgi:1-acyl-sn-glycerol-3-phosphate acyltransferase
MAQQAGVPVLPVTIWGSQRIWTKGRKRRMGRHHVPLFITVGEAVAVGPDEDAVVATARVKDVMRAQLEADQRAYPAWPDAERDLLPVRLGGSAPSLEQADAMDAADQRARRSAG